MNKIYTILFLIIALAFSANGYSQSSRRVGQSYTPSKKETVKTDFVQLAADKLTEDLALDAFQSAVIKDLLASNRKEQMQVVDEDIPNEAKSEKIKILQDKCIEQIKTILNPEQVKKYQDLIDKQKKKKK